MSDSYSASFQSELRTAVNAARQHLGTTFSVNANRGKAYFEIATVLRREAGRTGNDRLFQAAKQLEEQAEITTYSGANGRAALIGNYAAFLNRPDLYNVPLDLFSWQIDDAVVNFFSLIANDQANLNQSLGQISNKSIVAVDGLVWASKGLIDYFPGTALGIDYSNIPTSSLVWRSVPDDLRSQLSGRSFDRFTYAAAGGITVAASFANPVAASLGGEVSSFGFSAEQVSALASSSSVANQRYRLTKDEFGRIVIETLGTSGDVPGLFVYTSNGLDLASPLDNFLATGAAAFAPPGYIMEFVEQSPVVGDGTPLYQVRNIGGNYGFDLLKDRLGANFGNGGLRLRNNDVPGNTYFRPGDDTNLTASELFDFFSTSRTAYLDGDQRFYVAPQTSLVVDGIVKTGIVIGSSNSSGSSFYFQTYEKGPSGDKVTSVVRVEADSSGNIVSASISDEEATRALNLAEGARIRNLLLENAAGAAKNADNFESGKELSSLKDSIAVNVQGIQIEGDNQIGAGLQTISLLRPDSSSIPQVDPATGAILPGRLHRAPSLVSNPLNPNDGTVVFDQRGRVVDVDTALVNGVPTVVRTRASDGFYTGSDGLFKAGVTVETTYSNGRPVDTNIKINNNPVGIEFSQAGGILGQQLGYRLAKGNVLVGIVSSATLQTIGDNLGDVFDGLVGRQSVENATKDAFATFGDEFLTNLRSAGLGAISSFLTAELINALGVEGFAGELANTTAGTVIGQIVTNIANGVANPLTGVVSGAALASAIGSFLGTKLANEIHAFESIGGQIGSAVGVAAVGVYASTTSVFGSPLIAVAFSNPGTAVLAVAAFAAAALIGGLIGSVFGGTPRSGADASWDEASGRFVVSNVYSKKGGSKDAARSVAGAVADTFNAVLEAAGGTLLDPEAVQSGNYGMRKSDFVYRPISTRDKDAITERFSGADAATRLIGYGVVQGLTDPDFRIAGGDVYVKRALYNTFAGGVDARDFDVATITGNIASAQAYESYLANASVIGALVAAESDSVFAAETAITLARAVELGLTRRAASDWYGGFSFLLREAGAGAAEVEFGFDYDPFSDRVSRLIGVGDYTLGDAIDVAGQSVIEGGATSDTIDLRSGKLVNQTGLTVKGVGADGTLGVAATVDGGDGDDVLHASNLGDNLFGGAGNDALHGGRLDDWLLGGEGNDLLDAGSADQLSLGGDGNYLNGGAGDDVLLGREGSDWLEGGEGTDTLTGGAGDDILSGGAGAFDSVKGGLGDDQYIVRRGDGEDLAEDEATGLGPIPAGVDAVAARYAGIAAGLVKKNWAGGSTAVQAKKLAGGEDALVFGAGIDIGDIQLMRATDAGGAPGGDLIVRVMAGRIANDNFAGLKYAA